MNFLGHAFVALGAGATDPAYVLGAMLPDLASMARIRVDRSRLPSPIADGVGGHVEADAAFHAHETFVRGAAALRTDLTDAGLRSGPARAIGHVGWELLLDGTLIGTPTETVFRRGLAVGQLALDAIDPTDHPRWIEFLSWWGPSPQLRYDDVAWVGDRLLAMLALRPRLRFTEAQLPDVIALLEHHAPFVRSAAPEVLSEIVHAVHRRLVPPSGP